MIFVLLFIIQIFLLFFLSRELTKSLSTILFKFINNRTFTIYILAIFFFPGVVVHELAHLIVANILFVKTGEVEFFPSLKGSEVKLGSVAVAKTDPIRRFLIGAAPILAGLLMITGSFIFLEFQPLNTLWKQLLFGYILFVIGNTMYSSRKDMEGAIELFITLAVIFFVVYAFGIRIPLPTLSINNFPYIFDLLKKLNIFLLIPIGIDMVFIIGAKLLLK